MNYQTFQPHKDLAPLVKCYWTLEIPVGEKATRQRILPDGCIEMAFILGADIKRYTTGDDYIYQPRSMVIGQITEPFYIEPTGDVCTFAVRFYPFGFSNLTPIPIHELTNKETPLEDVVDKRSAQFLEAEIILAKNVEERIAIVEKFLLSLLSHKSTLDMVVKNTVDAIFASQGSASLSVVLGEHVAQKRQIERKFLKHIGLSPKQLCKVIRFQASLKMLLNEDYGSLSNVAYESDYYDQAHFIKDFKYFTGKRPKDFFGDEEVMLSSLFNREE